MVLKSQTRMEPPKHKVLAACPGSGGTDLIPKAAAAGATVFLTGEMKHHEQLQALRNGMSLILAGHTNTERGVWKPWTKVLQKAFQTSTSSVPEEIVIPSGGFDQRAILIILMSECVRILAPAKVNLALAVGPLDEHADCILSHLGCGR